MLKSKHAPLLTKLHPSVFHAAVLAGGQSSRMGRDKRFLKYNHEFLVDRAYRLATSFTQLHQGQAVLCGHVPQRECLVDLQEGQGPLMGVRSAVAYFLDLIPAKNQWLMVMPVDMPFLELSLLCELANSTGDECHSEGLNAIAFEGYEVPFVVRITLDHLRLLNEIRLTQEPSKRSIKAYLEKLSCKRIKLNPSFIIQMQNINYPHEWEKVIQEI